MESARPARPDDAGRIVELHSEFIDELRGDRGGAVWAARDALAAPSVDVATSSDALVLSGCIDDVVVGFADARIERLADATSLAVLHAIYVEPHARGVGVGAALLDGVIEWARARGVRGLDGLALPGNRDAKNFFEAHGLVARAIVVHRNLDDSR